MHSIEGERFWAELVPVPETTDKKRSLEIQRSIVTYLDNVHAKVATLNGAHEATEAELHRLEQAILDRAFRGEL